MTSLVVHFCSAPLVCFVDALNRLNRLGYAHATVEHRAKRYVSGRAHTNNLEGIWSNIKRGMDGVHHYVSSKYMQDYLDSYIYRYNHKSDVQPMFCQLSEKASFPLENC